MTIRPQPPRPRPCWRRSTGAGGTSTPAVPVVARVPRGGPRKWSRISRTRASAPSSSPTSAPRSFPPNISPTAISSRLRRCPGARNPGPLPGSTPRHPCHDGDRRCRRSTSSRGSPPAWPWPWRLRADRPCPARAVSSAPLLGYRNPGYPPPPELPGPGRVAGDTVEFIVEVLELLLHLGAEGRDIVADILVVVVVSRGFGAMVGEPEEVVGVLADLLELVLEELPGLSVHDAQLLYRYSVPKEGKRLGDDRNRVALIAPENPDPCFRRARKIEPDMPRVLSCRGPREHNDTTPGRSSRLLALFPVEPRSRRQVVICPFEPSGLLDTEIHEGGAPERLVLLASRRSPSGLQVPLDPFIRLLSRLLYNVER